MSNQSLVALLLMLILRYYCDNSGHGDGYDDKVIRGDDEPRIVSWRVLEGVTEPFNSNVEQLTPPWKLMKMAADNKAAELNIQQALHEYGQLLRHPYVISIILY